MNGMEKKATRDGFGEGLLEVGRKNPNVVALTADLGDSTRSEWFMKEFPERFFDVGISEQDMIGTAVGLSIRGKIPFATSFSCFGTTRAYDQIRVSVCYNEANVKLAGTHSGITTGSDGATAQTLEDIATMRVLPNMTVIVPCDAVEAKKATIAAAEWKGPVYIRLGREKMPIITKEEDDFAIGKGRLLREGKDVSIFACGIMVAEALEAADILANEKISAEVIDLHTVKPIDQELITASAKKTGCAVAAEEHNVQAGFGSAVCEVLAEHCPVPVEFFGMKSIFGESGEAAELLELYHLTPSDLAKAAKKTLKRKK
jgi:transketolase